MKKLAIIISILCNQSVLASDESVIPHIYSDHVITPAPGTSINGIDVIVNSPEFYKPIYALGHGLGFAWAGREGFDGATGIGIDRIYVDDSTYRLEPEKNGEYVYPSGMRIPNPKERLTVDVENISFYTTGDDLILYEAQLTNQVPKSFVKQVSYNCSDTYSDTATNVVRHEETASWTKSSTEGISSEVGIKQGFKFSVEIPLSGTGFESNTEISASFGKNESWTESNSGQETIAFETRYETEIPPKHKKSVSVTFIEATAKIPYTNKLVMNYDLKFTGFLRYKTHLGNNIPDYYHIDKEPLYNDWNGNAYRPNISQGETISYTFGRNGLSARDDILSQYVNDLSGYNYSSDWNWSKFISSLVHSLNYTCSKFENGTIVNAACDNDMQAWKQYGNQPLAEVLRRHVVQETGVFDIKTAGLFHVVSSEAIPMTQNEIAAQCAHRSQGIITRDL